MATPGCGTTYNTLPRSENRSSLLRSFSLNRRTTVAGRPPVATLKGTNMGFGQGNSHSLSVRVKALQSRKQKEQDAPPCRSQPTITSTPPPVRRNPRHLDLIEAASRREGDCAQSKIEEVDEQRVGMGNGMEHTGTDSNQADESPAVHTNLSQSARQIAYQKYLEESFGLIANEKPKAAGVQRLRSQEPSSTRPESDMSAMTDDSMEVNFHIAAQDLAASPPSSRDRRPKIQVTIPGKPAGSSSKHLIHQLNKQRSKARIGDSRIQEVSPPSSTTVDKLRDEAPARLSIVSPLSVVEMPKPRRPFSAFSLEDMTSDSRGSRPSHDRSTGSDSDDIGHDDDAASTYSARSSMSSISDAAAEAKGNSRRHSIAFSIMDPTSAGVFDTVVPPLPKISKTQLKHTNSTTSLALNTNKPLPPEPGLEEVAPLRLIGRNASRGSMYGKRKAPSPLTITRSSTIDSSLRHPHRKSSLRSKYTPADLDALDAAFESKPLQPMYHQKQPSLEEAELELEAHLGTIEEGQSPFDTVPFMHDPLQISRGPNEMVPTRQAPPPPPSNMNIKLSDGSTSNRTRLQKKPSVHVAMQMKTDGGELRKRISAPVGSIAKANRILGKPDHAIAAASMEREASSESNWSSSESPETSYRDTSSPEISGREASTTPDTDVSSVIDPAFEEVKARLELLSPKRDAHSYFATTSQQSYQGGSLTERVTSLQEDRTDTARQAPIINLTTEDSQTEIPITLDEQLDEPEMQPRERRGRNFRDDARSLTSIAISEIHDMYSELPPPMPSPVPMVQEDLTAEEIERMISADAAEKVLLRILQNLDNLQDLFATATVSRGFYRTFKRHELPLMKSALRGMSPAAWELREMSPPYPGLMGSSDASPRLDYTPTLYLQHYMRDMYTMIALKSMILVHCESFLRSDTITALAGGETVRASQIDDAFWRVWTFCQIFGCGSNREEDIIGQLDWLRGGVEANAQARNTGSEQTSTGIDRSSVIFSPPTSFGRGNAGGLSAEDLYDMTEIWTCLGVLVRGFQGKRAEARDFGIFANSDITPGDVEAEDAMLEEWSYHLLTLAPPAVLDVTSPTSPTAATFAQARNKGYTSWTPPSVSRATFLKEAVSRVYHEKTLAKRPISPTDSNFVPTFSSTQDSDTGVSTNDTVAARWRCARHAAEIRAKRSDPSYRDLPPSEDRPMSEFPSVLASLDTERPAVPPLRPNPLPLYKTHHRATPSETDTAKHMVSALVVPAGPQVRDPVDTATDRLVGMGFEKSKARRALAETDTGNSVDFEAALEWLVRERKRDVGGMMWVGHVGPRQQEHTAAFTPLSTIPSPSILGGGGGAGSSIADGGSYMHPFGDGGLPASMPEGLVSPVVETPAGLGIGSFSR